MDKLRVVINLDLVLCDWKHAIAPYPPLSIYNRLMAHPDKNGLEQAARLKPDYFNGKELTAEGCRLMNFLLTHGYEVILVSFFYIASPSIVKNQQNGLKNWIFDRIDLQWSTTFNESFITISHIDQLTALSDYRTVFVDIDSNTMHAWLSRYGKGIQISDDSFYSFVQSEIKQRALEIKSFQMCNVG